MYFIESVNVGDAGLKISRFHTRSTWEGTMVFEKRISMRLAVGVIGMWVLASCGGGGSGDSPRGPSQVAVPNVVGMTQVAASSAIAGSGLVVGTVTTSNSATVASGSVISQDPASATSVASGSAVNLTVSSGPAPVAVPNVVGMTQASATSAITAAGLNLGTVTMASSATVASGSVISQDPAAGTNVTPGSMVNLTISTGPAPVAVPNVVGMTQAAATTAITAAGLNLGTVTMAGSATVAAGSVISQDPLAATNVASGSAVNLNVSSGPDSTWQSFIGRSWTAAAGTFDNYWCYQTQAVSDLTITGFRNTTTAGAFRVFVGVSDTLNTDENGGVGFSYGCNATAVNPHMVYGFGAGTGDVLFPAGTGVRIKAGQYILLTIGVQNAEGTTTLSGTTEVSALVSPADSVTTEADLLLVAKRQFVIPKASTDYLVTGGCVTQSSYQVFAAWPLMNTFGTHALVQLFSSDNPTTGIKELDVDFSSSSEPIDSTSFAVSTTIHGSDTLLAQCTYNNPTGAPVMSGEGYNNESCMVGLYRYPSPTKYSLSECAD